MTQKGFWAGVSRSADLLAVIVAGIWIFIFLCLFLVIVLDMNTAELSSWVQAFGSIAAILAAGYFPIWHQEVAGKRREQALLEIMRAQADEAEEALWQLTNCFLQPEFELARMKDYLSRRGAEDFEHPIAALAGLPISDLPAIEVRKLGRMLGALRFGVGVARTLPAWIGQGSSHPAVLQTLREKREELGALRRELPVPKGMEDKDVDAKRAGAWLEVRQQKVDIHGWTVFRRHYRYHVPDGQLPKKVQVQIVFPDIAEHPDTFDVDAPQEGGWVDEYHLERQTREKATDRVKELQMLEGY